MKIICIGCNYADHAKELKCVVPKEPIFFLKPDSAIYTRKQAYYKPEFTNDFQYECEIVLRIGRVGKCIDKDFAENYIDGIGIGFDFTARDLQQKAQKAGLPWEIAKAFDFSAPISQFIDVKEFENINNIDFSLQKNGKIVQKGNTKDMIFSHADIISYVSQYMTIKIGDLFFTGTPAGVGEAEIGDRFEAYIGDKKMLTIKIV